MKKLALLIVGLAISISAFANDLGYSNTKWGMTPNEVIVAEQGRAHTIKSEKYGDSWGKVRIDEVKIAGDIYKVNFLFDTADKLIQANIKGDDLKNEGLVQLRFDSLHKLLTQKYGQPEFKSDDKVSWKTSSTTIELSKFILKSINVAMINISYKPNNKVEGETSNL